MKTSNLSRLSVNAMSLDIDGVRHIIHGDAELTIRDERSIRETVRNADTVEALRKDLGFYGRTLNAASK